MFKDLVLLYVHSSLSLNHVLQRREVGVNGYNQPSSAELFGRDRKILQWTRPTVEVIERKRIILQVRCREQFLCAETPTFDCVDCKRLDTGGTMQLPSLVLTDE